MEPNTYLYGVLKKLSFLEGHQTVEQCFNTTVNIFCYQMIAISVATPTKYTNMFDDAVAMYQYSCRPCTRQYFSMHVNSVPMSGSRV